MNPSIDLKAIFVPIPGENPAGEDLRYTAVYDEIREARRADDLIPRGEWENDVKDSDWSKVITASVRALSSKTKDLQIASWLAEALTVTEGFSGVNVAMSLLQGLLHNFWDHVYPQIEEDDLDYRVAPFEYLNDRLSFSVRLIPLTDPRVTPGYHYFKWQESREVGYGSDARHGQREEMLSEGKISAEEFDAAVAKSPPTFYKTLADAISSSLETFRALEAEVDERYGMHAPRLSDLGSALQECHRLVMKICTEQKGLHDALHAAPLETSAPFPVPVAPASEAHPDQLVEVTAATAKEPLLLVSTAVAAPDRDLPTAEKEHPESQETRIWNEALVTMSERGLKEAVDLLLAAAGSQPSERGRCRYRFLVAKLCLKGGRPELARPILEQLNITISELQLEKWESPFWICEVYEALYQCLRMEEDSGEDSARAKELFQKICVMDVTKALGSGT